MKIMRLLANLFGQNVNYNDPYGLITGQDKKAIVYGKWFIGKLYIDKISFDTKISRKIENVTKSNK